MASQTPMTRRELEALLIAKAWKDEAFAQELRTNARAAIERELGQFGLTSKLPDTVTVQVLEETPETLYLVLPQKPASLQNEQTALSDEDLEAVAGGISGRCTDFLTGCYGITCLILTFSRY